MIFVIVYHRGCADGFGAAWYLRQALLRQSPGAEVNMLSANWTDAPKLEFMRDTHVWCVDYCYEAEHLVAIADVCETLDVFDHHQTSLDYMREAQARMPERVFLTEHIGWYSDRVELDGGEKVNLVLDQTHSGVGLVIEHVRRWQGWAPPMFLWNLEDRDLWRFELADTRDIFAAVTARPYTIEAWDKLELIGQDQLVAEGMGINLYRDTLIESVASSFFLLTVGGNGEGWWIPCASSPYFIGSDVAGALAERHGGLGAYCILHNDRVQIGLRSRNDDPRDCAKIAEFHGGGGHPHASGMSIGWDDFRKRVWDCFDLKDWPLSAPATPGCPPA